MADLFVIPRGICQCGCGGKTGIARQTRTPRGDIEGQPVSYLPGHSHKTRFDVRETKFWAKMRLSVTGCWNWIGHFDKKGYGRTSGPMLGERRAHRVAYRLVNGSIPTGFDLDHLCRNHSCVNPLHLEAVTRSENILRGFRARRSN